MDPYHVLQLPHTATAAEIRQTYHSLARQHHPDKRAPAKRSSETTTAPQNEQQQQTKDFARIAEAYALLSDPVKKAEYDHIFKYGGFDHIVAAHRPDDAASCRSAYSRRSTVSRSSSGDRRRSKSSDSHRRSRRNNNNNNNNVGIGYTCHDPFLTFLLTRGRVQQAKTVAGLTVPSRFQNSWSVAWGTQLSGTRQRVTTLTRLGHGSETTKTVHHADGRKEVWVRTHAGPHTTTRRYVVREEFDTKKHWWNEAKNTLTMCYAPCHHSVQ